MNASILGVCAIALAWGLGSASAVVAWLLALSSLVLQARGVLRVSTTWERRVASAGIAMTLIALVMPIWGSHLGEPPRKDHPEDFIPHAHPIWELGHVH